MRFVFSFILLTGSKLLASVLILYYVMMHFPALINTHTHTYMHHAMCFCCLFIIIHTFSYLLSFSGFALIPYGVQYFFCVIKESTNPSYRSASNTGVRALAENNYYYSGQKRKSKKLLVLGSYDSSVKLCQAMEKNSSSTRPTPSISEARMYELLLCCSCFLLLAFLTLYTASTS